MKTKSTCQAIRDRLTLNLLGDLDDQTRKTIADHLARCADCKAYADKLEPALDMLRDTLNDLPEAPERLSDDHRQRVLAAFRERKERTVAAPRRKPLLLRFHVLEMAAVLIAGVMIIGFLMPATFKAERHVAVSVVEPEWAVDVEPLEEIEEIELQTAAPKGAFDGSRNASFSDDFGDDNSPVSGIEDTSGSGLMPGLVDDFEVMEGQSGAETDSLTERLPAPTHSRFAEKALNGTPEDMFARTDAGVATSDPNNNAYFFAIPDAPETLAEPSSATYTLTNGKEQQHLGKGGATVPTPSVATKRAKHRGERENRRVVSGETVGGDELLAGNPVAASAPNRPAPTAQVQPAEFDSVAIVKSPMVKRGILGNREAGAERERLLALEADNEVQVEIANRSDVGGVIVGGYVPVDGSSVKALPSAEMEHGRFKEPPAVIDGLLGSRVADNRGEGDEASSDAPANRPGAPMDVVAYGTRSVRALDANMTERDQTVVVSESEKPQGSVKKSKDSGFEKGAAGPQGGWRQDADKSRLSLAPIKREASKADASYRAEDDALAGRKIQQESDDLQEDISQHAYESAGEVERRERLSRVVTDGKDIADLVPDKKEAKLAPKPESAPVPAEPMEPDVSIDDGVNDPFAPRFQATGVNPFVPVSGNRFSTFSIDVDTASYTLARNYMLGGHLPPAEAVRTEEFVNFFDYAYQPPVSRTFRVDTEVAPSRFGRGKILMKLGVKGRRLGREEQRPASLTFLIDSSGSMNQADRLGLARKALEMLLDEMAVTDQVAIIQFDNRARLLLAHTPVRERETIIKALNAIQCGGGTNLEAGLQQAYEQAAKGFVSRGENRILLMSDGVVNLGEIEADAITKRVEASRQQGVYLSVFGFGMGIYDDTMLKALATKGNGAYAFIDSEAEARRVFVDDLSATLNTIAEDVKIQIEFNPRLVAEYRQLGYESRQLKKEQFRDDTVNAGEVGSGQSVTALYELELAAIKQKRLPPTDAAKADWLAIARVRYRRVDNGKIEEIEQRIEQDDILPAFDAASPRFRLAAGVAAFAEILRGSPFAKGITFDQVAAVLRPVSLELHLDQRLRELVQIVETAGGLTR
jgi:Ca-activated chloride channel family protein